jgi:hypothetical protein
MKLKKTKLGYIKRLKGYFKGYSFKKYSLPNEEVVYCPIINTGTLFKQNWIYASQFAIHKYGMVNEYYDTKEEAFYVAKQRLIESKSRTLYHTTHITVGTVDLHEYLMKESNNSNG